MGRGGTGRREGCGVGCLHHPSRSTRNPARAGGRSGADGWGAGSIAGSIAAPRVHVRVQLLPRPTRPSPARPAWPGPARPTRGHPPVAFSPSPGLRRGRGDLQAAPLQPRPERLQAPGCRAPRRSRPLAEPLRCRRAERGRPRLGGGGRGGAPAEAQGLAACAARRIYQLRCARMVEEQFRAAVKGRAAVKKGCVARVSIR
jgi:hypothetical protein